MKWSEQDWDEYYAWIKAWLVENSLPKEDLGNRNARAASLAMRRQQKKGGRMVQTMINKALVGE
jgi:hypothetical protein